MSIPVFKTKLFSSSKPRFIVPKMDTDLDLKRPHSIDKTVAIPTNHENPNHINIFNQFCLCMLDILYVCESV
jgi:hypothetical protein